MKAIKLIIIIICISFGAFSAHNPSALASEGELTPTQRQFSGGYHDNDTILAIPYFYRPYMDPASGKINERLRLSHPEKKYNIYSPTASMARAVSE